MYKWIDFITITDCKQPSHTQQTFETNQEREIFTNCTTLAHAQQTKRNTHKQDT